MEAIDRIHLLDGCLTAGAERSATDGIFWVAFELDDAPLTALRGHPASGGAGSAESPVVSRRTGDDVFRRIQIRIEFLNRWFG